MHLPSLIIILVFGLIMNNWQMIKLPRISKFFKTAEVQEATHLLHMVTAKALFHPHFLLYPLRLFYGSLYAG